MAPTNAVPQTEVTPRTLVLTQAVAEVTRRLGLRVNDLKDIVGISQPSATRLLRGHYLLRDKAKEWELSAHLVRLYRSLFSLVGGDDALASGWLRSPNQAFSGQKPVDVIKRIDGMVHVCEYLDGHRARV